MRKIKYIIFGFLIVPVVALSQRTVLVVQAKPTVVKHTEAPIYKTIHRKPLVVKSSYSRARKKNAIKQTSQLISPKIHNAVVVIDPGHGGKDPGATGPGGIHEKNIVLAIGKDLYEDLKKEPHIAPKMTRHGDYFVRLRQRLHLARKGKADLFVAIHADAFKDSSARGATVFALSKRGATSEAARWLAERENYSELGGVKISNKSYVLRSVLINLSQAATIHESVLFGRDVLDAMRHVIRMHSDRVEQARFVVLKSPDIPSLLIETGFISNRLEEKMLNTPVFQKRLAHALSKGIVLYLKQYPPKGTWFYMNKYGARYVVKKDDTLYRIAKSHHSSVEKIKQANNLQSNALMIGQVLHILK